MSVFDRFTGLYQVSKTLRFELKPIGKTLEHIEETGLIAQDEQRAREYKEMKEIIDSAARRFSFFFGYNA